jgi:hypothetical protein
MEPHVLREIRPGKTIPEAVLPHVVMIARHQVPNDLGKLPHPLDRLREGLWGELLFVVNVASQQHSRGPVFHGEISERTDCRLSRILEQHRNFRLEIHEHFADLEIGRMNQSHVLNGLSR